MIPPPPKSTLFPYTTLFRSQVLQAVFQAVVESVGHSDEFHRPSRGQGLIGGAGAADRKSTRLNSSHITISYAVFCLKKKTNLTLQSSSLDATAHHQHLHYRV